jgi:dipeptidyl aminopeptidase/acylaminoacyl peptidase
MITIKDILDVKYMGDWEWSRGGDYIGYLWDDGGVVDLWVVTSRGGEAKKVSDAKVKVSSFAWNPVREAVAFAADAAVYVAEAPDFVPAKLVQFKEVVQVTWNPEGRCLFFVADGQLFTIEAAGSTVDRVILPGKALGGLSWNGAGDRMLLNWSTEDKQARLALVDPEAGLLWTTPPGQLIGEGKWITDRDFIFDVHGDRWQSVSYYLADADVPAVSYEQVGVGHKCLPRTKLILREEPYQGKGMPAFTDCQVNPNGSSLLFRLERDGWLHHYLYDLKSEVLTQLTRGNCEDFGHAGDEAAWSPCGTRFAYASNRHQRWSRGIWVYDVTAKHETLIVDESVTNVQPKWSPDGKRIGYLHCDHARAGDLWVAAADGNHAHQLTFAMPEGLSEQMQEPEHVVYKGALGWDIDGWIFKPNPLEAGKKYPALVWVHGGPIRQLRGSWHHSRSYGHHYGLHQYLAKQGYVIIEINFRGGIGYGAEFRNGLHHKMGVDDVTDVVNAGRFLKSLPYVDPEKVGVYGLSYGGYMTLHCLTQYPDEFALGVNFAGIWDFAQWSHWIEKKFGRPWTMFSSYFGGLPEESPELWAKGSPVTFKSGLKKPLINFHGIKDANVDFEQMDRIVKDCVEMGAEYEAYYYPHEVHFFAMRSTWEDVLPKLLREFDRYLR